MKDENENNQFDQEPGNFGLPGGYFQKSASSIVNKIEWQEEHKEFPKLVELKNTNAFKVPENYFLKKEQQLELIQYPLLNSVQDKNVFNVPQTYFENLESAELTKVLKQQEDELEIFTTLNALTKRNNFTVPETYFSNSGEKLEGLLGSKAKVISLFSKRTGLAVAAMLLVVIALWIYDFYVAPVQVEDCGTIACIDKQDLVKTKNLERLDDEELYELVDPAALEKKLEKNKTKQTNKNNKDSSLNDISAEDLLDDI